MPCWSIVGLLILANSLMKFSEARGLKNYVGVKFLNKFMLRSQIIKFVFDFMPQTMSKEN